MPGGLLAVHAHPDDETLSSGGALASWAAAGLPATVVTCTRGERGEVIGPDLQYLLHDDDGFAAHRTGELRAAVAALGPGVTQVFLDELEPASLSPASPVPTPSSPTNSSPASPAPAGSAPSRYVDSGMSWLAPGQAGPAPDSGPDAFANADLEIAALRLAGLIHETRPDFVLSYDREGGYGHPDHVRARAVAQRAVELVPGTRLLEIVRPVRAHERMFAELGAELSPDWLQARNLHLADPAAAPAVVRAAVGQKKLVVHTKPVAERVLAALRAHPTQVQHVRELPDQSWVIGSAALSNQEVNPVPAHEYLQPVRGDFAGVSGKILPPNVAWGDGNS